jgi:hypothetical protein
MFEINFDAEDFFAANPETSSTPIPAGVYPVVIAEGEYLEIVFEIIAGEHKGRRIWERLNLWNPSPQAVMIAQQSFARLLRALGLSAIKTSDEILGQIVEIRTVVRRWTTDAGEERMTPEVRGYQPRRGASPASKPATETPW